jgi:hypothetical protein
VKAGRDLGYIAWRSPFDAIESEESPDVPLGRVTARGAWRREEDLEEPLSGGR